MWLSFCVFCRNQAMCDWLKRFVVLMPELQEHIPKVHFAMHMCHRMAFQGNARLWANWHDESLNKQLKLACRHASALNWEPLVFAKMEVVLRSR